jgi:hypothetical protein
MQRKTQQQGMIAKNTSCQYRSSDYDVRKKLNKNEDDENTVTKITDDWHAESMREQGAQEMQIILTLT